MILCCGEALMDMLPRKMDDGADVFLPVPGGAIFNTAIALGRLGDDAGFFSSISADMFGQQLIGALNASNVDTKFCVKLENPTTLAFVKLNGGQASYSFFDENSALRNLQESQLPELPNSVSALHFGAISLIPEPCGSAYEKFMQDNQDKVISIDPNIRLGFINDEASHRSRIKRMIEMADIVKVSDEDLDWIAEDNPPQDIINSWFAGETKVVLLTRGAEGVTAYTKNGSVQMPAMNVDIVDTIGAGDTFNAGFLSGLKKSGRLDKDKLSAMTPEQIKPALELATKVAAFTVSKAGANPPWAHEL